MGWVRRRCREIGAVRGLPGPEGTERHAAQAMTERRRNGCPPAPAAMRAERVRRCGRRNSTGGTTMRCGVARPVAADWRSASWQVAWSGCRAGPCEGLWRAYARMRTSAQDARKCVLSRVMVLPATRIRLRPGCACVTVMPVGMRGVPGAVFGAGCAAGYRKFRGYPSCPFCPSFPSCGLAMRSGSTASSKAAPSSNCISRQASRRVMPRTWARCAACAARS